MSPQLQDSQLDTKLISGYYKFYISNKQKSKLICAIISLLSAYDVYCIFRRSNRVVTSADRVEGSFDRIRRPKNMQKIRSSVR